MTSTSCFFSFKRKTGNDDVQVQGPMLLLAVGQSGWSLSLHMSGCLVIGVHRSSNREQLSELCGRHGEGGVQVKTNRQ